MLTIYLSKYDDMIERRKIDEEIDLLTGIVKPNATSQSSEHQPEPRRGSFLHAHNEEMKFEMQTLRNQPIQGTLSSHQTEELRKRVSLGQKYLFEMLKYSIFQQYYEAKSRIDRNER